MRVRLRITLLFVTLVFVILAVVCGSIYFFSYRERLHTITLRLQNRAITTARLFSRREMFDASRLRQIDSLTSVSLRGKIVEVYDSTDHRIYSYSDLPKDSLAIPADVIDKARSETSYYFRLGDREAVAYSYTGGGNHIVVISSANDQQGKQNLLHLRNILMLSLFWGIIVTLLTGYLFSGRLLKPIKTIIDDVSEISVQNLARRVYTGVVRDEWHALASTFNQLLDKLQEGFELHRRFLANASHELSTPLTSISSQLEVTLENARTVDEYRKVLESVHHDVRHMGELTHTLLEFALASGNKGGLEINLIRIDEIILRLPSEITKINKLFSVVIHFEDLPENEENLLVFGNEALLLTAIKNIVLNACKYSPDRQARIFLKTAKNELIILVQDNGIGIPGGELKNIFQPFYRLENKAEAGFGLGLSMAERIIKLHKGAIHVESIVGQGTSFAITLPAAAGISAK